MGIPGMGQELWKRRGCVVNVSIQELVRSRGKNVIVVDGSNFYGQYLYPKFDWIRGAFTDLVDVIQSFVKAFERIGVKLVFFFVEGHLNDGYEKLGSDTWLRRRLEYIEYTDSFFKALGQPRSLDDLIRKRSYYHTPLQAQPVVLFIIRHVLKCDVRFIHVFDRCDAAAYFARSNENCLALLSQDYVYLFYHGVPCLLSLFKLNLNNMTTVQYCPDVLAWHKHLEGQLYPFFFTHAEVLTRNQIATLKNVCRAVTECGVATARMKLLECLRGKRLQEVLNINCDDIEESENFNCNDFIEEVLRFNFGFEYLTVEGPLQKWELIKLRAQELYTSGQISNVISNILLSKRFFNDCILEDFIEFPPSSLIYQPLRKKMYGVLFHEEEYDCENELEAATATVDKNDFFLKPGALPVMHRKKYGVSILEAAPKEKEVLEWSMTENGGPNENLPVTPALINPVLHPGLLSLWTFENASPDLRDKKWQLFAYCISSTIDCELLKCLPPTLVVPTVVLHYLYQDSRKFLEKWEVETFIAQAVMLPKKRGLWQKINVKNIDSRVVKLIAIFISGCLTVRLLNDSCGCPIPESETSLYHYFDGKLFQSYYEEVKSRHDALHLCDKREICEYEMCQKIKQIVFINSPLKCNEEI